MARWKVLITAPYMQPQLERFRARLEAAGVEIVAPTVRERLEEAELLPLVNGIHGMICGDDRITARVIAEASALTVVVKWGTGIDSIDQQACADRGIAVRNTPGAFTEPVADTVLGYVIAAQRGLFEMNRKLHAGGWAKTPGWALHERTLGVVGVGRIGQAVTRRARAFGMRVIGCDPVRPPTGFLAETALELFEKAALLREADVISLNCDLNPTSYHLIGARELALMRDDAWLVNTARGPLIDEVALSRALLEGRIGGVALDVYEQEPLPADSALLGLENVILAAHNANASPAARERVHEGTIEMLLEGLRASGS